MRANFSSSSTLYASENDSSNMDFGNVANYRELVAQSKRNTPALTLRQYAAMSMAFTVDQTGGVQQLLNTLPKDVFQYVLPWLSNRHLSEILNLTPGGLSSLLIPQRTVERGSGGGGSGSGGNGLHRLHLSSQACRQALLKSVSDRINLMLVERPNLLASNGSIVYGSRMREGAGTFRQPVFGLAPEVRGLRLEWTGLQRTAKTFLRGFLNGPRDFYNFREVLDFFGNNGLTHTLDVSVHLLLTHFLLDEEFFSVEDHLVELNDWDSSRWYARLVMWLTRSTVDWRNRRIVASTVTSFVYHKVKQQSGSPLLGCYPPQLGQGLKRA